MAASIQYYTKDFPGVKETTVRDWKNAYRVELNKRAGEMSEDDFKISELPEKKTGWPLLLGEELDKQVQAYITSFRESGAVVNTAITMACAEGIVIQLNCQYTVYGDLLKNGKCVRVEILLSN